MGYTERQDSLRAEALRTVPGVMAAKHRDDVEGAAQLIDGFRTTATQLGVTDGVAWSILWSATIHWAMELAECLAENREVEMDELLKSLGRSALEWMCQERGVGGY